MEIENINPLGFHATLIEITNYTFTPLLIFIAYRVYSPMKQLIHDQKQLSPSVLLSLYFYRNIDMSNSQWGNLLC